MTVLFDFDGVLVDTIEIFSEAVNTACQVLNQPVMFTPNHLRNIKRMSIAEIVAAANVDPTLSKEFIAEIDRELYRRFDQINLFPDIAKVVKELHQSEKLGIVSASSVAVITEVLNKHGIVQYFDDIIGGDIPGTKCQKILSILSKNNSDKSRSCMIGDTVSDVEQGKAAGVVTVAVSWGWHAIERIRTLEPHYEAFEPGDLIDIVRKITTSEQENLDSFTYSPN